MSHAISQKRAGLILDQYHTDSLIRVVLGRQYPARRTVPIGRSVPRRDVLTALLLYDHVYIVWPYWLERFDSTSLDVAVRDDLIRFIPQSYFEHSLSSIATFLEWSKRADMLTSAALDSGEFESVRGEQAFDVGHTAQLAGRQLAYYEPLLMSGMQHLKCHTNIRGEDLFSWIGSDFLTQLGTIQYSSWRLGDCYTRRLPEGFESIERFCQNASDREFEQLTRQEFGRREKADLARRCAALDAASTAGAVSAFAASSSLPVKCVANACRGPLATVGDEAYQLVRVQFESLRYPVVESFDDVRRLRDDRHLKQYRAVIFEYSERMREDLEQGRKKVLSDFQRELNRSLASLSSLSRWRRVDTWCFWLSLPLAIVGALTGIPIGDVVLWPANATARFVPWKQRKELDWLLFGNSPLL